MFILITEDQTDFDSVKVIIRRIADQPNLQIKGKGFSGAGEIKNKAAITINALLTNEIQGCVIVRDCDGTEEKKHLSEIKEDVVNKIKPKNRPPLCIVLPKEEIEAWYLADIECVTNHWPQWRPKIDYPQPELLVDAKKTLTQISRNEKMRPRYSTNDGKIIAQHLNLDTVRQKCPSFEPLYEFIRNNSANA